MEEAFKEKINIKNNFSKLILPVVYNYLEKQNRIFEFKNKEEIRDKLFDIKSNSLNQITKLKKKAISNLSKNGVKVFEAKDAKEAKELLLKITKDDKLIVKSKTNVGNEIGLKDIFTGKKLLETDIGDFIVSLSNEQDSHPVLPAISMSLEKIAGIFEEKFGVELPLVPEKIVEFIRDLLRKKIYQADCAITGANVITSDGQIVILENEGNISLISRIPPKHIVLAGFEKIVPNLDDSMHIVKSAAIWGTGQNFPSYVNIISGPSKTADIQNQLVSGAQGAKEVYLILLDNGRSELIQKGYQELLYCINCGACVNFCPAYHQHGATLGVNYRGINNLIKEASRTELENVSQKAF